MLGSIGHLLVVVGALLIVLKAGFVAASKMPSLGRLPGDIAIRRGGMTVFIPLATSALSTVVTFLFNVIVRFLSK